MALKAVFFDLDGTLLPFDRKAFEKGYGQIIYQTFLDHEDPMKVVKVVMASVKAMTQNHGPTTNEQVFLDYFMKTMNDHCLTYYMDKFMDMYATSFNQLKAICEFEPLAKPLVDMVKSYGLTTVLATNPLFPQIATYARCSWSGVDPKTFDFITTYENSISAKPDPHYFNWLVDHLGLTTDEVILVGNDCIEDGAALQCGIDVFLVDRYLEHGELKDQMPYVGTMAQVMETLKGRIENHG